MGLKRIWKSRRDLPQAVFVPYNTRFSFRLRMNCDQ
jgi:hypothetical protein